MNTLRYLNGYPEPLLEKVRSLIADNRLEAYLLKNYAGRHDVQSDKALYAYVQEIRQRAMRNAPPIDKVIYDSKLDVMHNALGLHTAVSRNHGGKLKASKEIRIASLFRDTPEEFLEMIVVHELAHLREREHNKSFYQLCEHMLPGYAQREFDLRLWLTWKEGAKSP